MTKKQIWLLVMVLVLAAFFRFYGAVYLDCSSQGCTKSDFKLSNLKPGMPGGLFPDEAANGLDINLMQSGQTQPFYERGNGREALFFYMLWGSVEVLGKGPWQHHIVSGLVGLLSVLLCFLFTRRLMLMGKNSFSENFENAKKSATNIALLAAFFMAVSTWHVVLSRTAFRANLIPLFATLTMYLLLCLYQAENKKNKLIFSLLAGASFALGFYTYIAYRILAPILFMVIVWPWFANGFIYQIRNYWKQFLVFLAGFAVFFYPLGKYFYTHAGSFLGRSGQVSVFNPELNQGNLIGAIGEVFKESVLAYFMQGDLNWRHNVSGLPFLSQLISPFFGMALLVALGLALVYFFRPRKFAKFWKYFLLTGWFWGMLLPVITTAEGIPHGLRSIGTIPAVFILSAIGVYWVFEHLKQIHQKIWESCKEKTKTVWDWKKDLPAYPIGYYTVKYSFKGLAVLFFVALIVQSYSYYFVYAANSPENFYAFRSDLTVVSDYLKERCKHDSTYLILDKFSVQTTDYLTSDWHGNFNDKCNVPYKQVDPENSWDLKNLKAGDEIVFTQSSIFDIKKFKQYHPEASLRLEHRNKFGQAVLAVYEILK